MALGTDAALLTTPWSLAKTNNRDLGAPGSRLSLCGGIPDTPFSTYLPANFSNCFWPSMQSLGLGEDSLTPRRVPRLAVRTAPDVRTHPSIRGPVKNCPAIAPGNQLGVACRVVVEGLPFSTRHGPRPA